MKVCVTGAGGFIGGHLVRYLKEQGHWVRGVDVKRPEFWRSAADQFVLTNLTDPRNAKVATRGVEWVFGLAANMGGMGFIGDKANDAAIMHNNTLCNLNTLHSAAKNGVARYLFSSSACIYPAYRQTEVDSPPLREEDAYPAGPADAYGWEKLYFERVCAAYPIQTRMPRFHNTYGPQGAWTGGREKAPAALCRKVAQAKLSGDPRVEIWGDGQQTRTFLYIDDLVRALLLLIESDYDQPINLGSDRLVTIDELAYIVAGIAGVEIELVHVPGIQGVRGRDADLTRAREALGWQPQVSLEDGLARTYQWIEELVHETSG
jgi:nucleoside-diphosphate-sugar epimerase